MPPQKTISMRKPSVNPFVGSRIVTVNTYVSVDDSTTPETHYVHEDLLVKDSPFFKAALKDHWTEGATGVVPLHEVAKGSFIVFARWIYSHRIHSTPVVDLKPGEPAEMFQIRKHNSEQSLLLDSYILGELLQATDFKDAVLDAYLELMQVSNCIGPKICDFKRIWDGTQESSSLRRFTLDGRAVCTLSAGKSWKEERHRYTPEMMTGFSDSLEDWLIAAGKRGYQKPAMPKTETGCKYHDHVALGTPCYRDRL